MHVELRFMPRWRDAMLGGIKTHTCRTRPHGAAGDTFTAFDYTFKLVAVWRTTLGDVARNYYRQEGVTSPTEYAAVWVQIHPRAGYRPEQEVWLHEFRLESQVG